MSRLLKITDNGNGILVQGTDNILYPDNATLTFPYNSIILVTDESDIATFRSASNNDVLFSGLFGNIEIGSTTVTKANIIEKFDEIANQASGGGGGEFDPTQYYTKSQTNALLDEKADESDIPTDISELNNDAGYITNSALNGYATEQWVQNQGYLTEHQSLAQYYTKSETDALIPDVSDYFDGAEYDSNTKHINFKHGNTVKAYIDATAFIKDGMVDTVEISNGNLVITFNTDAGKQPISIPLTDIFNPANYYDKTATDTLLAAKANSADLATVATSGSYDDLSDKPTIPSLTGYATESWVQQQGYAESANLATVATSGSYNDLSNKPTIPAAQVQSDWEQSNSSSVDYIKNKPDLSVYAESSNLATVATSGDYDDLSNKPTIPTVPTNVSDFTNDAGYLTEHQSLAEYYTKTQSDAKYLDKATFDTKEETISTALNDLETNKQDTLIAGTNISIQNNVISASGSAAQIQSDWAQNDSNSVDYIKNKPDLSVYAQSSSLATVATSGSYNDLSNKPSIPTVPTNVSAFTNDAGYLTQHQSLSDYYTKSEVDSELSDINSTIEANSLVTSQALNDISDTIEDNSLVVTQALNNLENGKQDVLTAGSNITITNNVISATGGTQVQSDWNQSNSSAVDYIKNKPDLSVYAESANLATVATSGSYNDLSDKPTIPSVSNKADKVANATSGNFAGLDSNGNLTDSGSKASDFQATLVSGTNIKTINNESILGSGNITIQGGGTQVQSDWNQTDTTAADYIKNKPTIPDTSAFMTTAAFDIKEEVISTALNELDARIGDINTLLEAI